MNNKNKLDNIDPKVVTFLSGYELYALRAPNGRILNVSYTEEGLKYTLSRDGRYIYFKNAQLVLDYKTNRLYFKGNTAKNPSLTVERFIPKNHSIVSNQLAEYRFVYKALRLCYNRQRFD